MATPKGGGSNLGRDQARGSPRGTGVAGGQEGEHLSLPGPFSAQQRCRAAWRGEEQRQASCPPACLLLLSLAWWHVALRQGTGSRSNRGSGLESSTSCPSPAGWPYLLASVLDGLHASWPPSLLASSVKSGRWRRARCRSCCPQVFVHCCPLQGPPEVTPGAAVPELCQPKMPLPRRTT